ncbi:3-deoxy-D-manno-octulosonic acid transferase [Pelistega indica]|uniref:3-deoxy-D-manno-octulosonic acid transferase n=1 Tax=Pelistega indica TaxID=1414851 RepID=V8G3V3_9BURK|nr:MULTISPECIES: 3-deoxy-D-manno-octulosonic acid transferase [Pelistega]ETD70776.1 3-deoxy-D-manno-octulosonic acid transferase [Pelistega indica]
MNQFLYTLLLRLAKPIILNILEKKAKKAGGLWDIRGNERFGIYPKKENIKPVSEQSDFDVRGHQFEFKNPIWVHAVSLGETRAAQPFVRILLDQGHPVLLTHTTSTGRAQGARQFSEDIGEGRLVQAWMPYDLPEAVDGFLTHWMPRCGILIEREVWPNMVLSAACQKIPMILASARFSESSAKQVKLLGGVLLEAYKKLSLILAQTQQDAERLESIGLPMPKVIGNLKFDVDISMQQVDLGAMLRQSINRHVVVIASTREGEEQVFIQGISQLKAANANVTNEADKQLLPLYVIIPRHPQRFAQVEEILKKSSLTYVRRTDNPSDKDIRQADVLFGDSLGEMFYYYGLADVAIIGGSFGDFGGQNHIEACAVGVPVIVGPHTKNFEKAVNDALIEGAARRTDSEHNALLLANALLNDDEQRKQMGKAGKQWLTLHQGVSQRLYSILHAYLN